MSRVRYRRHRSFWQKAIDALNHWAHTPTGDGCLCAVLMLVVFVCCYGFAWAAWIKF